MEINLSFFKSTCVSEFRDSFFDFAKPIVDRDDLSKSTNQLRNIFFEYFKSDIFLEIYQKFAGHINNEYNLINQKLFFQVTPTPRVFIPGAHGTNWHCDYWYGHGKNSKTVWVPIENVVPGSTFSAVKKFEDNRDLYKYYSEMPELLTKKFDLMGAETFQVCPPKNTAAIFDTNVLHGSTKNITDLTRLSFDFRFTINEDETSTKNLDEYLHYSNGKLIEPNPERKDIQFLKYICGGRGIDTKSQHMLIEASCKDLGLSLVGQEAEIERFDYPMLKFHIGEIQNKTSLFSGIVIASKRLLDDSDVLGLLSRSKVAVFFALEQEWM
jgi:ectoine hydroxylase-related dioxygenase (phytanoyl-CoA dioxygenase family)